MTYAETSNGGGIKAPGPTDDQTPFPRWSNFTSRDEMLSYMAGYVEDRKNGRPPCHGCGLDDVAFDLLAEVHQWRRIAGDLWNELENHRSRWQDSGIAAASTQMHIDEYERLAGIPREKPGPKPPPWPKHDKPMA